MPLSITGAGDELNIHSYGTITITGHEHYPLLVILLSLLVHRNVEQLKTLKIANSAVELISYWTAD